ncbi:MAG: hypothetical protein AAF682_04535 [Planctomycetota bacterium]
MTPTPAAFALEALGHLAVERCGPGSSAHFASTAPGSMAAPNMTDRDPRIMLHHIGALSSGQRSFIVKPSLSR